MSASPDPHALDEQFDLPDGRRAWLRPIAPEDAPAIMAGFERLSPETIRMRFFSTMKQMPRELADRLTRLDPEREAAFVIASPKPPGPAEIFAVARLGAIGVADQAEMAILVRDDVARRGVGTRLMGRLIDYARQRRLKAIYGLVLPENHSMIELCRRLGFRLMPEPGQAGLLRVTLDLSTAPE